MHETNGGNCVPMICLFDTVRIYFVKAGDPDNAFGSVYDFKLQILWRCAAYRGFHFSQANCDMKSGLRFCSLNL